MKVPRGRLFPGSLQVSRHADPLGKPGDRREKEGEQDPERRAAFGPGPVGRENGAVPPGNTAEEKGGQGGGQEGHDDILKFRGPVGAHPGEDHQEGDGCGGDHPGRDVEGGHGPEVRQGFAEPDAVEGDRDRLGQEQDDADGAAEFHAEGPGDQVVVPPAFHLQVGGHRRQGDAGQHRDDVGHADNDEGPGGAGSAHHIAQPQEEDDAQDGQYARGEHPGKGV